MHRFKVALWIALPLIPVALLAVAIMGMLPIRLYPIHTSSMVPALPMKTLIIVHKGDYREGDIITFHHRTITGRDEVITHRFIGRDSNGFIVTKGDANPSADAWPIKDGDVIGGTVLQIPQAGYWLVYLKNPAGLGSLVLFAVAIWLLWPEMRRKRSTRAP